MRKEWLDSLIDAQNEVNKIKAEHCAGALSDTILIFCLHDDPDWLGHEAYGLYEIAEELGVEVETDIFKLDSDETKITYFHHFTYRDYEITSYSYEHKRKGV